MSHNPQPRLQGRNPNRIHHENSMARASTGRRSHRFSKLARFGQRNERLPYMPPEKWNEPIENGRPYKIQVQKPGVGYRHVLTAQEVRDRLAQLPSNFTKPLEFVLMSQMTIKKTRFPCYGMQWGTTLYLYPIEEDFVERFANPPTPAQYTEARMYGGQWNCDSAGQWTLTWSESAIKDFYANNILIHELGHLLDDRNTRSADRERYAEWFALEYGYKPTQATRRAARGEDPTHGKSRPRHGKMSYHN